MEEKGGIKGVSGAPSSVEVDKFKASTAYETVIKYLFLLDKKIQENEVEGDTSQEYDIYNVVFKGEEEERKREGSTPPNSTTSPNSTTPSITHPPVNRLLLGIGEIIREIQIEKEEQRYGNTGFITFMGRVKKEGEILIKNIFFNGKSNRNVEILQMYLQGSFGNQTRIDYGTGHELNFFCFLIILHRLKKIEEREFFLGLEHYFGIIRALILKYKLEPAGSHGSWGIDDYQLLPFVFGASQFCRRNDVVFSSLFALSNKGLCYSKALRFVHVHKTCSPRLFSFEERVKACDEIDIPEKDFADHSPNSYSLKEVSFAKINKGMLKMYDSVVLSEYVVIQHFISSEYLPV